LSTLLFPENVGLGPRHQIFIQTELGHLYQAIPFKNLAELFKDNRRGIPTGGRKPIFDIAGGLGLMFLKHYLQLSDKKLIERVNSDWQLQMFCGVQLSITQPVRDKDIVGRWRRFFSERLSMKELQDILAEHWGKFMENEHVLMDDATCYESYIKYPTDVKLLYDCSVWVFNQINAICEKHGIRKPRTKYKNQKARQLNFAKKKRKTRRQKKSRKRQLLYWVRRGIELLQELLNKGREIHQNLGSKFYSRLKTIQAILEQQQYGYDNPGKSIRHRIVSLYKPYIRPIVRGKETKRVEFGAKVHMSQVDQINFIEYLDFEAYHEGIRMWKSIHKHRRRFGKCSQYAGDKIYANNKNRKYCSKSNIHTCFKRKGRASKIEDQKEALRGALGNARATLLEGSFGNEKNHYLLRKIKARLQCTEIAWIFFGVHTANAVKIAKRMQREKHKLRQAA